MENEELKKMVLNFRPNEIRYVGRKKIKKLTKIAHFKIIFSSKRLTQPTEFRNGNSTELGKKTLYGTSSVKGQLYLTNCLFFILNHHRNILKRSELDFCSMQK